MIQKQSADPDVTAAATTALTAINEVLSSIPPANSFDYGGHQLKLGDYDVCRQCTTPIAEAQAAAAALSVKAEKLDDEVVAEHLRLAAKLFQHEAEAAIIRADFHNGHGTEAILNRVLGYQYERHIGDEYQHSHHKGAA